MSNTTVLSIRDVPETLQRQIKAAAALRGQTLREWVLDAIKDKLIIDGIPSAKPEQSGKRK